MGLGCISVQPVAYRRKTSALVRAYHALLKSWRHSQIGHRSQYSVERLLAFQDYHQRTSMTRVVAVCIVTPIPAMLAALLIDSIPLRPPSDGWRANHTVWIRLFLDAFAVAMGLTAQVKEVIVTGVISNTATITIAFATAAAYVLLAILVAATWRFPVPFGAVISVVPMVVFLCSFTVIAVGPSILFSSPVLRKQIKSQLKIVATQGFVAVIFPTVSAIFYRLSATQQIAFVFITPFLKFATKQMIASSAEGLHEYVGLVVVFSVDLFNVFYVAICMQSAKSAVTTLLMIASDSFHVVLAVRVIFQQVNVAKTNEEVLSLDGRSTPTQLHYFRDLPGMIRGIFGDAEVSHARSRRIRVFAPFPLPLSDESVAFMNEITRIKRDSHVYSSSRILISGRVQTEPTARAQSFGRVHAKRELVQLSPQQSTRKITTVDVAKQNQVAPAGPTASLSAIALHQLDTFRKGLSSQSLLALTNADPTLSSKTLRAALVHSSTEEVVWDALQALFHSEYLLMAEYIECALPLLYAGYLSVLFHLPSAQFYPSTASSSAHSLATNVANIVVFAAVESAGFAGLLLLLKRKFGVSPLYQLAFVLETQARTLQGHLFVWAIFILHMPLAHYGVDFDVPLGTL